MMRKTIDMITCMARLLALVAAFCAVGRVLAETDTPDAGNESIDGSQFISLANDQPFDGVSESLANLFVNGGDCYERIRRQMDVVTFGALYDYIDEDSIPISLAIPTIERTPMFTGFAVETDDFNIHMTTVDEQLAPATEKSPNRIRRTWKIASIGSGILRFAAHGVYPFRRNSGRNEPTSYKVEVLARCFFSSGDFDFSKTRLPKGLTLKPQNLREWMSASYINDPSKAYFQVCGTGSASFSGDRDSDEDCKVTISFSNNTRMQSDWVKDLGIFGLAFYDGKPETAEVDLGGITGDFKPLRYYNKNGAIKAITEELPSNGLKLNFAMWFRIIGENDKTVDLVPAVLDDDKIYNGSQFNSYPNQYKGEIYRFCGSKEPVLPMQTEKILDIDLDTYKAGIELDNPGLLQAKPEATLMICCDDPRYNFAPEDWYTPSDFNWSTWLAAARNRCDGSNGRPRDIFQFVSNCGYLQSMGELQFLPVTENDQKAAFRKYPQQTVAKSYESGYLGSVSKYDGEFASSFNDTANNAFMWRTHWAFGPYADWAVDVTRSPYMWGIKDIQDDEWVTSYEADNLIILLRLSNTPYDWTIVGFARDGEFTDYELYRKYSFNDSTRSEAPFKSEDLSDVAAAMHEDFIDGLGWDKDLSEDRRTTDNWNDDWWGSNGNFFGVSTDTIDDIDRRYLYSYWKNIFGSNGSLRAVDAGKKGVFENDSNGGYVVHAKEGVMLRDEDFNFSFAKEAYRINITPDGKTATVNLNPPVLDVDVGGESEVSQDESDPLGILVDVDESLIAARPTVEEGESVGALPIKAYEGLWYQASWGDDLGNLRSGEKVQATGDTLYLGVIKQTGDNGFYKLSVSEK